MSFPGAVDGPWGRYVIDPNEWGIGTVRFPRRVAKDDQAGKDLTKRTLTNLYNNPPAWLIQAHRRLDEAVYGAYGWPSTLSDDDILSRLLELNLQRPAASRIANSPDVAPADEEGNDEHDESE